MWHPAPRETHSLQFHEVLSHGLVVEPILAAVRERGDGARALGDLVPRHVVLAVDRVSEAGRSVVVREQQPAGVGKDEDVVENVVVDVLVRA